MNHTHSPVPDGTSDPMRQSYTLANTSPLERQFGQVPGLAQMTSTSSAGSSVITLQFVLELNIDVAEQQVLRFLYEKQRKLETLPASKASTTKSGKSAA